MTTAEAMPLGELLDSLNVRSTAPTREGHLVASACVVLKMLDADGCVYVATAWSDGLDWITKRGMIEIARDVESREIADHPEDDEDPS